MEQFQNLITRTIKSTYKKRLVSPAIYLLLLLVLWWKTPISELVAPIPLGSANPIDVAAKDGTTYVTTTLTELNFTGYTQSQFGMTIGYYYYQLRGSQIVLVLLTPNTCEEGLPYIESVTIAGKLSDNASEIEQLTTALASDLSWTTQGVSRVLCPYLISEPAYRSVFTSLLTLFYLFSGAYALASMVIFIMYILFPSVSPTVRNLGLYGKANLLLAEAEEELATLPQLATEDMFITEHYFIAFAARGVSVIPISEIVWIYKHSTLHNFLWYHFSISYTLHISANKHLYIQLPKNMKSDIDGIIDYLGEANHNILVGFNEKNRLAVQEMQGVSKLLARILAFLNKRI